MASSNDPDAWLGLLKWSLAHQDGTAPSEARPMSDEDRAWLEKVVSEGVRDDFKVMTEIYGRLCSYLDRTASASPRPQRETTTTTEAGPNNDVDGDTCGATGDASSPSMVSAESSRGVAQGGGALSTFVAAPAAAVAVPGSGAGGRRDVGGEEGLEGVMNDLEELQDIVEQIDMAATFAKIGGLGRLIALVTPSYRPQKLRLRAASVIATLTKNNPPAQAAFRSSSGERALLQAVNPAGDAASRPSCSSSRYPLQRAILHALSCSVMGQAPAEDALCQQEGFPEFIGRALAQEGEEEEGGNSETESEEGARLRSKAAFVLKALIGAPGATSARVLTLWPAVLGLLAGLEAVTKVSEGGAGLNEDPAAARETCIEALLAAARSVNGERVVSDMGPRVSAIMSRRRRALVEATGRSEEDEENTKVELGLWMQWENLSGPAQ